MTPFCFINCTNIWPNSLTPHVCLSFVAEVVDRVQWNSYPCKTSTMILSNEYLSTKNDSKIILAWSGVELLILIIKIFKKDVVINLLQDSVYNFNDWGTCDCPLHFLLRATCSLQQVPSDQIFAWKTAGNNLNWLKYYFVFEEPFYLFFIRTR